MDPQWRFSLSELRETPSCLPLEEEMSRRHKGIDWLMRVGATLRMGLGPCLTAATYFHRFYMRRMLEDYHEYEIAATCLFLASKTEENGKRLEDLVIVALAKIRSIPPNQVAGSYDAEAKRWENVILTYEEVLLEVLCFDFNIHYPHAFLADIASSLESSRQRSGPLVECIWSVAHDSYRTPLCVLESPQVIAAACLLFAQSLIDGPEGPSLTQRLEVQQHGEPNWRQILGITENDLQSIAIALTVLCQFYRSCAHKDQSKPDVTPYKLIEPPTLDLEVPQLFKPVSSSSTTNGIKSFVQSTNGSKTPADPLGTVPSTPFPLPPVSPSPMQSQSPTSPLSGQA
ncbi:hypothetical protein FRC15_008246 [Serendipita sp. 397]|nr:hypothetical protein FRC15_008246 [Serendipita sp. 397]